MQAALLPELAGAIPESLQMRVFSPMKTKQKVIYTYLELSGHATVASGDTAKETVELSEVVGGKDGIIGLGGRMHLGQDLLGKSLGNPRITSDKEPLSTQTLLRAALTGRWWRHHQQPRYPSSQPLPLERNEAVRKMGHRNNNKEGGHEHLATWP